MPMKPEKRREWSMAKRKLAIASGICTYCNKNQPSEGFKTCQECRNLYESFNRKFILGNGFCIQCGCSVSKGRYCLGCSKKASLNMRAKLDKKNLCCMCKRKQRERGMKSCKKCQERYKLNLTRLLQQKRGTCFTCSIPCESKYCNECLKVSREKSLRYRQNLKSSAFSAYGGTVCSCCGERECSFLTIDHLDNNGSSHRKEIKSGIYFWLKKNNYPPGFAVRCFNCNCGRTHCRDSICPHKGGVYVRDMCQTKKQKERKSLKDAAYGTYGGYVCSCCGETTKAFLTLDHLDNDGADQRRKMDRNRKGRNKFYSWLRKNNYPKGIAVRCWNCNCGRVHQKDKKCPHQTIPAWPIYDQETP